MGGAGDFLATGEDVEFFGADETASEDGLVAAFGKFRRNLEGFEGGGNPIVDAPITFLCAQRIPGIGRRKDEAVGPIRIVGDETATRGAADERTQSGPRGDVGIMLGVTEGGGGLSPAIKAERGRTERGALLEESFVKSHVPRGCAPASAKKIPGGAHVWRSREGQRMRTSQSRH